jgi:hypothetical protein
MSPGIFYGIFEIAFLLSSCYLLNRCVCSSPLVNVPIVDVNEYYVITKDEYERLNDKQPMLSETPPPVYKALADQSDQTEPAESAPHIQSNPDK